MQTFDLDAVRKRLEKQQYRFSGRNTAVKICTWTKKSLLDEDVCYKQKFYGIQSHRCCQMSPAVNFCQNSCIFCWRSFADTEGFQEIPKEIADDPEKIIDESIKKQRELLSGFGGNKEVNRDKLKEAQDPKHFAISLTGEPTLYPYLDKFIEKLHERGITTFVVTNGLRPEVLRKITPTQLYVSVDAPNEELYLKVDRPKVKNAWQIFNDTLEVVSEKRNEGVRTCLRITLIKGINDVFPEQYAELIKKANPLFVEVKAYMHVGDSVKRLKKENMPLHEEVKEFAEKISKFCDWKVVDEKKESRVVLLMKDEDLDKRFIEFE
ncbi:MAG: tRNA wybutosine-synthesizing protein 1 [Candidatus Woesearchaeota archaeon]|nr:tRNA wybutosine-synthesizing protein 1 [Candidatus Woesearchaeota archaeon]